MIVFIELSSTKEVAVSLVQEKNAPVEPEVQSDSRAVYEREVCDRCGHRAYVEVVLPGGHPLTFCAHHYAVHEKALSLMALVSSDARGVLR